jgi:chain length determinant protein tyrosine kinase EpsG
MSMQQEAWQGDTPTRDDALGDILQRTHGLTPDQVEQVVRHQREHQMRFGEAAVALGLAKPDDVIWALAQQYHYPYTPSTQPHHHDELVVANDPFCEDVEAFRDLRAQLMLGVMARTGERHALAITSSDAGDGKTFVAANLAVAFSQMPGRTLLIDANLRQPRLHKVFGVDTDTGLAGILAGRAEPNVIKPVSYLSNLYLMPAGLVPPNPSELLQRPSFSLMLLDLLSKFDHVLVDTPSHAAGSDARVVAVHCGAALVVGRRHASRTHGMQHLVKLLGKSQVKLAGVLINEF